MSENDRERLRALLQEHLDDDASPSILGAKKGTPAYSLSGSLTGSRAVIVRPTPRRSGKSKSNTQAPAQAKFEGNPPKPRRVRGLKTSTSLSLSRLNLMAGQGGFPTVFRPQVGALGGATEPGRRSGALALFAAALTTLLVANSAPMDRLVQALQSERPTAIALPNDAALNNPDLFQPLFGPQAINECSSECYRAVSDDIDSCQRACAKLSLSEYARRIRFEESSPELDAETIVRSCDREPLSRHSQDRGAWNDEVRSGLTMIRETSTNPPAGDLAKSRLIYSDLRALLSNLRMPPPSNSDSRDASLTGRILQAGCLRAHHTLVELGLMIVRQNSDEYSFRYFSRLNQVLLPDVIQAEASALRDGKSILGQSSSTKSS